MGNVMINLRHMSKSKRGGVCGSPSPSFEVVSLSLTSTHISQHCLLLTMPFMQSNTFETDAQINVCVCVCVCVCVYNN